jgi:hypothetical protein
MLSETERRALDEIGFVRLDGLIDEARRARLTERIEALFALEGERAGSEFKREPGARRLGDLADKGDVFIECMLEPLVLARVGHVLGPRFYCRSDKPQQQYQKRLLRPETERALSPAARELLALDDAENDRVSSALAAPAAS